jgi:hypothetical protein
VRLRLVLTGPARVQFVVIGPAPSCRVAGRFVLAGHRGLNRLVFRGRVRGRLLRPGTYTIVPQPAARSRQLPKAVAVAIDARGVRPSAPVRWRNCGQVAAAAAPATIAGDGALPASARSGSDVAAVEAITPAQGDRPAEKRLVAAAHGLLPSVQKSSLLAALLLVQLAVSLALLTIASVGPNDATMRFRPGQVLVRHRPQIAFVGGALLVGTGLLFLLAQLTS